MTENTPLAQFGKALKQQVTQRKRELEQKMNIVMDLERSSPNLDGVSHMSKKTYMEELGKKKRLISLKE